MGFIQFRFEPLSYRAAKNGLYIQQKFLIYKKKQVVQCSHVKQMSRDHHTKHSNDIAASEHFGKIGAVARRFRPAGTSLDRCVKRQHDGCRACTPTLLGASKSFQISGRRQVSAPTKPKEYMKTGKRRNTICNKKCDCHYTTLQTSYEI